MLVRYSFKFIALIPLVILSLLTYCFQPTLNTINIKFGIRIILFKDKLIIIQYFFHVFQFISLKIYFISSSRSAKWCDNFGSKKLNFPKVSIFSIITIWTILINFFKNIRFFEQKYHIILQISINLFLKCILFGGFEMNIW